jgi:hypothetical protein
MRSVVSATIVGPNPDPAAYCRRPRARRRLHEARSVRRHRAAIPPVPRGRCKVQMQAGERERRAATRDQTGTDRRQGRRRRSSRARPGCARAGYIVRTPPTIEPTMPPAAETSPKSAPTCAGSRWNRREQGRHPGQYAVAPIERAPCQVEESARRRERRGADPISERRALPAPDLVPRRFPRQAAEGNRESDEPTRTSTTRQGSSCPRRGQARNAPPCAAPRRMPPLRSR